MRYRELKPTPSLRPFVECFWTLEGDASINPSPPERILPDGCVELILNFGDRFLQHDGFQRKLQPRNYLVGQMTGPVLISASERVELLGIRFQPSGTRPFVEVPAHEFTDRVVELGSISTQFERELLHACAAGSTLTRKIAVVDKFLARELTKAKHDSQLLTLAANVIDSHGVVSVDELASQAGISSRQLERRFLRDVGIGPKLLARIIRFQQVFRAVDQSNPGWADVAFACGYYDQAHLIRDFKQFAQQTPAVLLANRTPLTESFTRKTRMSGFSNTAA